MKNILFILVTMSLFFVGNTFGQKKLKEIRGKVCGNPTVKCKTGEVIFEKFEIPFEIPKGYAVISSQSFYAIILKSTKINEDGGCGEIYPESERLEAQKLFPSNKVFAYKCWGYTTYYTGINEYTAFLAVYGGNTLAEAQKFMKYVEKSGKFEGAYIKKLQAEFNGT